MRSSQRSITGPVLIFGACFLWAFDGVLRRSLNTSLPPITIVFFEHLIGFLLLLPFFWPAVKQVVLTKRIWKLAVIVSLFASLLGTLFFTTALAQTNFIPFSVVFLLQKLQPLFAIGIAAILLKEPITKKFLLWAGVAIVAAYFVTFPGGVVQLSAGMGTVLAAILAILAAACWGSATPFSKLLLKEVPVTVATGLRFGLAALFAIPLVFILGKSGSLQHIQASQLGTLVLIALSTGMVALWVYYQGLSRTRAQVAAIIEMTWPLLAVLLDVILYQTVLAPTQYLAAVIMLMAVWQVTQVAAPNATVEVPESKV